LFFKGGGAVRCRDVGKVGQMRRYADSSHKSGRRRGSRKGRETAAVEIKKCLREGGTSGEVCPEFLLFRKRRERLSLLNVVSR